MMSPIPQKLSGLVDRLPKAKLKMYRTKEERIADLKKKFNLQHGKGNRKRKRKGK